MGKIVIGTNVTLDGVVQDPDGQEGFELGGWFHQFVGKDLEDWTANETEERWVSRPYCWAGGALSGSRPGGHRRMSA